MDELGELMDVVDIDYRDIDFYEKSVNIRSSELNLGFIFWREIKHFLCCAVMC